jgi:hypothetical protein
VETNRRANERRKATLEANRIRQKLPLLADLLIEEHRLDWKAEEAKEKLAIENKGKPYTLPPVRNWSGTASLLSDDVARRLTA